MKIIKATAEKIKSLRDEYLNSLPEFQELYLELMVVDSNKYMLIVDNEAIGYTIITNQGDLIEFYLNEKYIPRCSIYFNQVINELSVKSIYCKSFDYLLLNCCLLKLYTYSLIGVLYRDYYKTGVITNSEIIAKQVDETAVGIIMQLKDCFDELFETVDYLRHFIKNDNVFLFYKGDDLIGCGTLIKTHSDWNFCDIGVWVHKDYRKKGIGTQIILYLRDFALSKELEPSCGCSIENIASQKTIEKSGFVSKHKLIEFKVNN